MFLRCEHLKNIRTTYEHKDEHKEDIKTKERILGEILIEVINYFTWSFGK